MEHFSKNLMVVQLARKLCILTQSFVRVSARIQQIITLVHFIASLTVRPEIGLQLKTISRHVKNFN